MSKNRKRALSILGYLIGFSILGVILYFGGLQSIELAVTPIFSFLFFSFLANLSIFMVSSVRWGYIINQMAGEKAASYFHYFAYFVSGRFFGQYVSQAGGDLVVRPGLLNVLGNVQLKTSLTATFLEKIFDLTFIAVTVIPCALYLLGYLTRLQTSLIVIIILTFLLFFAIRRTEQMVNWSVAVLKRIFLFFKKIVLFNRFLKDKHLQQIESMNSMLLLKPQALLNTAALTILRYGLLVTRLYFLNLALELTIPTPVLIVGIPIAQLGLIFAFTPGALGILEAGWYGIFALAHVPEVQRSAFLLAQRVYWSIFIGIIFITTYVLFGADRVNLLQRKTQEKDHAE